MALCKNWIWLDSARFKEYQNARRSAFCAMDTVHPVLAVFRKTFRLEENHSRLIASFSGDSRYRLFVNGQFVTDGPVEAGGDYENTQSPNWWFQDSREITSFCRKGTNVIVAEVLNAGLAQTDYSMGHPGFTLELEKDGKTFLQTDSTWKTARNRAYIAAGDYHEKNSPGMYHAPDFDDSSWTAAEKIASRWNLKKLDLPPLTGETVLPDEVVLPFPEHHALVGGTSFPLTVRPGMPVVLLLKFKEEIAVHLEWDIESGGDARIQIEYQETPGITHHKEVYTTDEGRFRFRSFSLQAFQYLQVTVYCCWGFSSRNMPVTLHSITAHTRGFPLGKTAPFSCSDPAFEKIRLCCDRTLRLCMQRLHLDSPVHHEGLGCTGDYMIEALMSYALYGESRLAAADLRRTAFLLRQKKGKLFHTSYTLLYIQMLRDYYFHTGDTEILSGLWDTVVLVLGRFSGYVGKEGLLSNAPDYLFIDWVTDGEYTYHHPPASRGMGPMTAFYYKALLTAAELAGYLGKRKEARLYAEQAESIKTSFHKHLWNPKRKCYVDGLPFITEISPSRWLPPEDERLSFSVHTNALALAYGLVPKNRVSSLADKMMTDQTLVQTQPYFLHFVFEALYRNGMFEKYGFRTLLKWLSIIDEHPSSLKETWNGGDYSHAWGGTPAWQLTRSVLGLEVLTPGFRKISLTPVFGPLSWLKCSVPTPFGMIDVSGKEGRFTIRIPEGIEYVASGNVSVIQKKSHPVKSRRKNIMESER